MAWKNPLRSLFTPNSDGFGQSGDKGDFNDLPPEITSQWPQISDEIWRKTIEKINRNKKPGENDFPSSEPLPAQ